MPLDGVRLTQKAESGNKPKAQGLANGPQDFELTAPVIDFNVAQGHVLQNAETSGAAQITIVQAQELQPFASFSGASSARSARL